MTKQKMFSKRLQLLADMIGTCERVIDVGTDHAHLPIYLLEQQLIKRAIGTDINKGPYQKAKLSVALKGLANEIDIVMTDGVTGINLLPDDVIVIAGMGGFEIVNILEKIPDSPGRRLILQPNWTWIELRSHLSKRRASFINELLVTDKSKIYCAMEVILDGKGNTLNEDEIFFGPILREKGLRLREFTTTDEDSVYRKYWNRMKILAEKRALGDNKWYAIIKEMIKYQR